MKFLAIILTTLFLSPLTNAATDSQKSICGKVTGVRYNKDTNKRPYELSGFWIKQSTTDVRVTYGTSPELIEDVQNVYIEFVRHNERASLFICLDEYSLEKRTYAKRPRTYGHATEYRIWLNGHEL